MEIKKLKKIWRNIWYGWITNQWTWLMIFIVLIIIIFFIAIFTALSEISNSLSNP